MTENSMIAQAGAGSDLHTSNGPVEKMKAEAETSAMDTGAKKAEHVAAGAHSSPKKRRKVNHGKRAISLSQGCWRRDSA